MVPEQPPPDSIESTLAALFAAEGPLARAVRGFRPRASQLAFAQAVARAIRDSACLIAEAGTGTGKTFAYLVPAMVAGGKVIVSTATKALQDQLFAKDVPAVRDALALPIDVALLKGRSNYLCTFHLARNLNESTFGERVIPVHLKRIAQWSKFTRTGDRADLSDVPENSPAWPYATSTRDNCVGADCPDYKRCFLMRARKAANDADLVVVNHHLFFADLMLRDEGVSDLLPSANTIVFDEAHHLADIATTFFGEAVSSAQLIELARDARMAAVQVARDYPPLQAAAVTLDRAARDLRLAFASDADAANGKGRRLVDRLAEADLAGLPALAPARTAVHVALEELAGELRGQQERDDALVKLLARAENLQTMLRRFEAPEGGSPGYVRWVELYSQAVSFHSAPLDVGPLFRKQVEKERRAWIFTSATLSVRGDFSHYQRGLGLEQVTTATWESPFDFASNALLYVPHTMPPANAPGYIDAVVDAALPVIDAAGGRTFLLCTSLRAMQRAGDLLRERLKRQGMNYPVWVQGEASKLELLARFKRAGNAILVASQSFWEGVDVKGEALSLVVIDKLPFAPPDDPMQVARARRIGELGGSAFFDMQLPEAVITLKQGVGRLIRDETDRGVLMICDTRLAEKGYGKRIWRSLPPFRRTRQAADAVAFFGGTQ
jgi:ATP-dependent DNA helicase DinG